MDRPFMAAELFKQYLYNYNIMAVLVFIPLIIALIFKIISCKVNDVDKKEIWLQRAKWALG